MYRMFILKYIIQNDKYVHWNYTLFKYMYYFLMVYNSIQSGFVFKWQSSREYSLGTTALCKWIVWKLENSVQDIIKLIKGKQHMNHTTTTTTALVTTTVCIVNTGINHTLCTLLRLRRWFRRVTIWLTVALCHCAIIFPTRNNKNSTDTHTENTSRHTKRKEIVFFKHIQVHASCC